MKKTVFSKICLFWVCLLLIDKVAASPEAKDEDTVTLRLQSLPLAGATTPSEKVGYELWQTFVEAHPEIKFKPTTTLILPYGSGLSEAGTLMQLAGESAPDVLDRLLFREIPNYVAQDFLYPLDEYLNRDEGWLDKKGFPTFVRDVGKIKGHYYAVVQGYGTSGLMYRKILFEESGLDPDTPPQTWDEFYQCLQRLYLPDKVIKRSKIKGKKGQVGMKFITGWGGGHLFTAFVWQAGGDMVRQYKECPVCKNITSGKQEDSLTQCFSCEASLNNIPTQWKVVYDEEGGVRALNFYKKLRWSEWTKCPFDEEPIDIVTIDIETGEKIQKSKNGWIECPKCHEKFDVARIKQEGKLFTGVIKVESDIERAAYAFFEDEVVIRPGVPRMADMKIAEALGVSPQDLRYTPIPYYKVPGPNIAESSPWTGWALAINGSTKDKKVRDAAWEYIKFMCGSEAEEIMTRIYVENGFPEGVNPPTLLKKYGYPEEYEKIPANFRQAFEEMYKNLRVEPIAPGYQNVATTYLSIPIDTMLKYPDKDSKILLRASAEYVNKNIMKIRDHKEISRIRKVSIGIIAMVVIIIIFALKKLIPEKSSIKGFSIYGRLRRLAHISAWMFMLPALLLVLVFQYYPLLRGSLMSFFDYKLLRGILGKGNLPGSEFIWLDNFINIILDPFFWQVILQTLEYVGLTLLLGFFTPFILALYLSEVPRAKVLFRTIFYLPTVTTGLVIMFIWRWIYDPSSAGFLNTIIGYFGFKPQQWLADPIMAMVCVIIPGIWAGAGAGSIVYLAALKGIPEDFYEQAELDGASILGKIWHVTIPHLKALIIINFLGAFIGAFHAMENIFVMTGGGPINKTRVIGIEIWINAFLYMKFGYATAMAWILGVALIGLTIYQLRILKRVEFGISKAE